MIPIKTAEEITSMRNACRVAATVLDRVCALVAPGVSTYELDQAAKGFMDELGAVSACYNYQVGRLRFPGYTCISVNEEVVHGIPSLKRVIRPGDIVSVDVTVRVDGFVGDNARTVMVEPVPADVRKLCEVTEESLYLAIDKARAGNRVCDISQAVERHVSKHRFGIVRKFVGHGVGRGLHEEPQIPNYGREVKNLLKPGMTLAIEPMINLGTYDVVDSGDGWTYVTRDRRASAHYEHTVLVTDGDPEILTKAG